ncbi:hypothetical protein BBMA_4410 [Burkholderia pseudomallei MSHR1079]|nr:hypothetical protein X890_3210 [Burkholderia pseudomallei MSHR4299]KKB68462.1 hypothetical protein BBMA_4410 [Burkholderia pseudomallei MSHR1079]
MSRRWVNAKLDGRSPIGLPPSQHPCQLQSVLAHVPAIQRRVRYSREIGQTRAASKARQSVRPLLRMIFRVLAATPRALWRYGAVTQCGLDPLEQELAQHSILNSLDRSRGQSTIWQFQLAPQNAIRSLHFERCITDACRTHHDWHRHLWMHLMACSNCRVDSIVDHFAFDALALVLQYIQEPAAPAFRATNPPPPLRIKSPRKEATLEAASRTTRTWRDPHAEPNTGLPPPGGIEFEQIAAKR